MPMPVLFYATFENLQKFYKLFDQRVAERSDTEKPYPTFDFKIKIPIKIFKTTVQFYNIPSPSIYTPMHKSLQILQQLELYTIQIFGYLTVQVPFLI